MGNATNKQDFLRIFTTFKNEDINTDDIATVKIKYRNPKRQTNEFPALLDKPNKTIFHDIAKGSPLLISGTWTFWGHATMNDGRVISGDPFTVEIKAEGY